MRPLTQQNARRVLGHLDWDLAILSSLPEEVEAGLLRTLRERVGLAVPSARHLGAVEHVFTHRRLRLHVFRCDTPSGRVRLDGFDAHRWLAPGALHDLPLGKPTRKALELLASENAKGAG